MAHRIKVWVDQTKCIGSALCVDTAPDVFALDESGRACVVDPEGDSEATIWEAAEGCPVSAIIIEDIETLEQLYP
ncbi:MAG: ferredoxin [Armatimonadetes bacterium]|nr:ferredoxin [Armatimonadota bacterium]MDW8121719.1 ferredoxin [Armatimonadota bacterium]